MNFGIDPGGNSAPIKVDPAELGVAASAIQRAANPISGAGTEVGGAKAHVVGFAMTDAVNAFTAAWSASLAELANQVDQAATAMTTTQDTYSWTEADVAQSFAA